MSLFPDTRLFLGTFTCRIDGKGRVSFPAPFRNALLARQSQGIAITRSLGEPALEGITLERLNSLAEAMEQLPFNHPDRRRLQMLLFGGSHELSIDKEGRCSPPRTLLDQVKIGNDIIFVGSGSTFHIWDPTVYAARFAEAADDYQSGRIAVPLLSPGVQ
jgi:MraZ protein